MVGFGGILLGNRMWGRLFDYKKLINCYGVIYLITSLPKVFPSLSFAVPSRETL